MRWLPILVISIAALAIARWDMPGLRDYAQAAPFDALPGVDLPAYRAALSHHRASLERIASSYERHERRKILAVLAPLSYLAALGDAESTRRSFIGSANAIDGLRYLIRVQAALAERERAAQRLARELRAHPLEETLVLFDGTTDSETIARALDDIRDESRRSRARLFMELWCAVVSAACEPPSIEVPARLERNVTGEDREALALITTLHEELSDYAGTDPVLYRFPSDCRQDGTTLAAVWYREMRGTIFGYVPLPTILMHPYADAPSEVADITAARMRERGTSPSLHKRFKDAGVRYLYQPSGNLYYCSSSGEDASAIARMRGVRDFITVHASAFPADVLQDAEAILAATVADEHEIGMFVWRFASRYPADPLSIELTALWRRGTYRFEEVIRATTAHDAYLIATLAAGDHIPYRTLLTTRSYPSIFFRPIDASPSDRPAPFLKSHEPYATARFGVSTYASISRDVGEEVLANDLRYGFSVMSTILEETVSSLRRE